jgi:hypothetical protein
MSKVCFYFNVELVAAKEAGFYVSLAKRPGNAPIPEDELIKWTVVENFAEIK